MSNLYNLYPVEAGYTFTTVNGDKYFAYFTPFTLQTKNYTEIETVSFGFECKRANPYSKQIYDSATKNTIVHLIKDYFSNKGEGALLYICLNNDEKGRHRNIIFSTWFNELGQGFERYKSKVETENLGFFSAIIIKENNPNMRNLISAFYFTIDYWFPEEE